MNSREKNLKELESVVNFWKSKLDFSLISLVFFSLMSVIYVCNPFFGFIPTIVFVGLVVVFVLQTIRSYNYLKFSKISYNAFKIMFDTFE